MRNCHLLRRYLLLAACGFGLTHPFPAWSDDVTRALQAITASRRDWRDANSYRCDYSVQCRVFHQNDPALNSEYWPRVGPSESTSRTPPFWRISIAKKGDRRLFAWSVEPAAVSPPNDKSQIIKIMDGDATWEFRPGIRNCYRLKGHQSAGQPQQDLFADVIGISVPINTASRTLAGKNPEPYRLDEALQTGKYVVAAPNATVGSEQCLFLERKGVDRLWLSPRLNYAIVKREWHWEPGKPPRVRFTNDKFKEVLRGCWLPMRSMIELFGSPDTAPGTIVANVDLTVDALRINITDDEFVPPLVPGTSVQDDVVGFAWIVPKTAREENLGDVIRNAKNYITSKTDRAAANRFSSFYYYAFASSAVIIVAAIAIYYYRRRAR